MIFRRQSSATSRSLCGPPQRGPAAPARAEVDIGGSWLVNAPPPPTLLRATAARCAAGAGHLNPSGTGAETGTGGTAEQVSCHPFPRPVRRRALPRGRKRRRGTTGPRLLPQRSARRAEGSWSGREEAAREAPTLSCRTGRGTTSAARRRRTLTTAQPAPRAARPEGCSWPGPAAPARPRRRRSHRAPRSRDTSQAALPNQ